MSICKTFFYSLLILASLACTALATLEDNPLVTNSTDPKLLEKLRALRQDVVDTGCNINLCFGIQGDDFITDQEFQDQKDFIDLMVSLITTDEPGNFCAVQYGRTTQRITPLTRRKLFFLNRVQAAKKVGGLNTNIAAALGYLGFQMKPRSEDANKLILLGDGLESVGFRPIRVARRIRRWRRVDISVVAVGAASYPALKQIVGGDENKIFNIDGFFELGEVVVGLIVDVCGFDPTNPGF